MFFQTLLNTDRAKRDEICQGPEARVGSAPSPPRSKQLACAWARIGVTRRAPARASLRPPAPVRVRQSPAASVCVCMACHLSFVKASAELCIP
jgi:hypothetical protein